MLIETIRNATFLVSGFSFLVFASGYAQVGFPLRGPCGTLNPFQAMRKEDEQYMRQAIKLARRDLDRPSCQPRVGVVVVAGGRVVGKAYAGADSSVPAVISALNQAAETFEGTSIYSTVEPSVDAVDSEAAIARVIASRPARLVIGASSLSPSLLFDLSAAGIEVATGVCEHQCLELNEAFFKYRNTGLPFVTLKFAQSLDGRLATSTGGSRWISSPDSLTLAHQLRREHDSVMVGIGTVLADDPQLTVRLVKGRHPLRVVVDSRLRIPSTARLLSEDAHRTLIATRSEDPARIREIEGLGAEVITVHTAAHPSRVDLAELLDVLGKRGIASVLVEGGSGLITSLLAERLVDRLVVIVAPTLIGRGIEAVGDLGVSNLEDAITFSSVKTRKVGQDVVFDARLNQI